MPQSVRTDNVHIAHVSMTSTIVIFIKNKCNFLPSLPGAIKSQSLKEAAPPVVPQKSIFHPIPQNLALIYRTIQRREGSFWCGWFCLGLIRVVLDNMKKIFIKLKLTFAILVWNRFLVKMIKKISIPAQNILKKRLCSKMEHE